MCICEQSFDQMVDANKQKPICDSCLPEFISQVEEKYNCNILLLNDNSGHSEYQNVYMTIDPEVDQVIKRLSTTLYVFLEEDKTAQRLKVWGGEVFELQWLELFYALQGYEPFTWAQLTDLSLGSSGRCWLSGDLTTVGYNVEKLLQRLELFQQIKELLLFFEELQEKGMTLI